VKPYESPADISSYLLNFKVFLREQRILDESGYVKDMTAFKEALVTTIQKAIVIEDLSKLEEKLKEERPVFVKIKVSVVFSDDEPVRAYFRRSKVRMEPRESLEEYTAHKVNGVVRLTGSRELSASEEEAMFSSLAEEVAAVMIFDEEPAPLAEALRDMIQE